jgi:hypothetical protein
MNFCCRKNVHGSILFEDRQLRLIQPLACWNIVVIDMHLQHMAHVDVIDVHLNM